MRLLHSSMRLLGCALAISSLSACALLIPENPSAPRYNNVIGAPRKPQLNNSLAGPSSMAPTRAPMGDMAQQAAPVGDIVATDAPPPMPQGQPQMSRQMPMENGVNVAQAGYPDLRQVPAAPPASEAQRMNDIRNQLEFDRQAAEEEARRLRDAAAREPSLIAPPPPVYTAPMPPPLPSAAPAPIMPQTNYAPPAPMGGSASMEPITLRPPSVSTPKVGLGYAATTPPAYGNKLMAPAMAGGFNPMEGGEGAPSSASHYVDGQYLAPSRYITRRN